VLLNLNKDTFYMENKHVHIMANHSIPPKMDTASGLDDFISFTTQFQTRSEIHSFLRMALFNHESDVVISILRKGY